MASVDWFRYEVTGTFSPGQSWISSWGEDAGFKWFGKVVSVSVMPFDAFNQNRAIELTRVTHYSSATDQHRTFEIQYRNTGVETIFIHYVFLGIIRE